MCIHELTLKFGTDVSTCWYKFSTKLTTLILRRGSIKFGIFYSLCDVTVLVFTSINLVKIKRRLNYNKAKNITMTEFVGLVGARPAEVPFLVGMF